MRHYLPAADRDDPAITSADAKRWAELNGIRGELGGWLRHRESDLPVCQGWDALRQLIATACRIYRCDMASLTFGRLWDVRRRYSEHRL